MIFITQYDSLALWQTYLSDPASITMEGILIFNKHLLFLLTVIVLFGSWSLLHQTYSSKLKKRKFNSELVHSETLKKNTTSSLGNLVLFPLANGGQQLYWFSCLTGSLSYDWLNYQFAAYRINDSGQITGPLHYSSPSTVLNDPESW